MTANQQNIIDAAFEVAVFSRTHTWPAEGSPEFFEFATKLDKLSTALSREHPALEFNLRRTPRDAGLVVDPDRPGEPPSF